MECLKLPQVINPNNSVIVQKSHQGYVSSSYTPDFVRDHHLGFHVRCSVKNGQYITIYNVNEHIMSVKFQLCSTNHCFLLDMQGFLRVQPSSHNRLLLKNALPALPASLISCQMGQASGAWTAWRIELAYLGDTSRLEMMSVMAIEYNMITVYIYIHYNIYILALVWF